MKQKGGSRNKDDYETKVKGSHQDISGPVKEVQEQRGKR